MKPLTMELAKGQKRELHSLGWKTPKEGDCRRHFYALDPPDQPLVVTPKPAMPEFYDPNRQAKAVFTCDPFPEAVCVEISPCRLLPPPCYQSREEFESQLPAHYVFEPWRAIYWETHREVSLLEPSDYGPLEERLEKWLVVMRKQYEYEAGNWRKEINRLTTATLAKLGLAKEDDRAKLVKEAEAQLGIIESETPIGGVPCKGRLKLTLEDVKRGSEGIRDAWMQEDWANKNGEDLGLMSRERLRFRKWLVTHTGTPANIYDMTTKQRRQGIAPPDLGEKFEQNPQFLEACAQVRYRARIADNAGTVIYLEDCDQREELSAVEHDEVFKLIGVPANVGAAIDKAGAGLATHVDRMEAVVKRLDDSAEAGADKLTAAGDHVETKSKAAAQTLRQVQKELQPILDELETNQARLEAVVEEYKLKENPVQTRRALANHRISKQIIDFILKHLMLGNPVPKAPTAARQLQKKYATKDGLDRKTVDRHYRKALPFLRAAGWPEHLLPTSNADDPSGGSKTGKKPQDDKPAEPTVTNANGVEPDSSESLTAFERIQQQEHGSADQP